MMKVVCSIVTVVLLLVCGFARGQEGAPPASAPAILPEMPTGPVTVKLRNADKLPSSPGYFRLCADVSIGHKQFPVFFGLLLPQAYFASKEPMPMVVALHNRGLEGSGAGALDCEGMVSLWTRGTWDTRDKVNKPTPESIDLRRPGLFIGVAPQAPRERAMHIAPMPQVLTGLLDAIAAAYRVDTDRTYLTGFSYGGTQVWQLAEQLPERFAAIVPLSARATDDPAKTAAVLARMPVYIGLGETESFFLPFSRRMNGALLGAGNSEVVYRAIPGGNHFSYCVIYTDPAFWEWLLAKRISQRPATRPATTQPTL